MVGRMIPGMGGGRTPRNKGGPETGHPMTRRMEDAVGLAKNGAAKRPDPMNGWRAPKSPNGHRFKTVVWNIDVDGGWWAPAKKKVTGGAPTCP